MKPDCTLRACLREPIPEIAEAASYLDEAVSAHLDGQSDLADKLIRRANMRVIREWTESLWGPGYLRYRIVSDVSPGIPDEHRVKERMPYAAEKRALHRRDGYHCRFCGIPVIRAEVRARIRTYYPNALPWGRKNTDQHAAFQAMWVVYDHLLPHSKGGTNELGNIVVACAPCNNARCDSTLNEVGLINPMTREPVNSKWDGLERFR